MNNINLKNTAEELLDTFFQAGKIAKEICKRGVKVEIKPDKSPVTDGDLAVDKILKAKIQNLTPHITIISEETVNINDDNKNNVIIFHSSRDKKKINHFKSKGIKLNYTDLDAHNNINLKKVF